MKRLVWMLDIAGLPSGEARGRKDARLPGAAPVDVLAVLKTVSDLTREDGFTDASHERIAAKSGVCIDIAGEVLSDLLRLGVFQQRDTAAGKSLMEPSVAIMQVYRLVGWSELPQHRWA
jgi:hypothetical protein